jgi:hypothetical protein
MLPLAAFGGWFGYLLMVYGLSQVDGQRYTLRALAIPGWYKSGLPGDDGTVPPPATKTLLPGGWKSTYKGNPIVVGVCGDGSTPNLITGKCKDGSAPYNSAVSRGGR